MTGRYRRKPTRQSWSEENMKEAIKAVHAKKMGWLKAAKTYDVPQATLRRRATNKNKRATGVKKTLGRFYSTFDEKTEKDLANHIKLLESRLFGLTTKEVRQLAFQFAERNNVLNRFNKNTKIAGKEWLRGFLKRNRDISLRQPEATSAARATAFNRPNVSRFFELLSSTIQSEGIKQQDLIYNMDESGLSTVQKPPKVLAATGKKQVGALTSAERGQHVTCVCCMNAVGNFIPPALIFPRKNKKDELLDKAPPGSLGLYQESGWMTTELFVKWLQHFYHYAKPTPEKKIILLLDGHSSHKSLEAVTFAREKGIILLCFPAHCTHRMQPLDITFFGPLKVFYNEECTTWLKNHPGRTISVYQISELFGVAYGKAATVQNATSGFASTGICPFNSNIFPEHLFLPADTTDRVGEHLQTIDNNQEDADVSKNDTPNKNENLKIQKLITFENISPLPKATTQAKRRISNNKKYSLLTCSPNLIELKEKADQKRKIEEKKKNKTETTKRITKSLFSEGASTSRQRRNSINYCENEDEEAPDPFGGESDEDEVVCLYCNDLYSNSRSKESWIKCMSCSKWGHALCAGLSSKSKIFICELCS